MNTIKQLNRRRIARSARMLSSAGAIAILLSWAPASVAAAEDELKPDSVQSQTAPQVEKSDAEKRGYPDKILCAEARDSELNDETVEAVGCGLGSRFADATPAGRQATGGAEDVYALLALHVESRNMVPFDVPFDDQMLPGLTRMLAERS